MVKSFITSFKIKNTYRVNSIIYSIKQVPIIKKILPNTLYKNRGLKIFGNIISTLLEVADIFLGKFIYIMAMILSVLGMMKTGKSDTFIHIFILLTIIGGFMNTYMFNPSKDKYYAMILMRMDAKKYTLSNYYYSMIKVLIGFLPFTILFGTISQVPVWICCLMPIFVVCIKMMFSCFSLIRYNYNKKVKNENKSTKLIWISISVFLILAYGLPSIGIALNELSFILIFIISIIGGIYSLYYIQHFAKYKEMYKEILMPDNVFILSNQNKATLIQSSTLNKIENDITITSNKTGFAYFHDLFVKRHKKILTKSAKKTALISFGLIMIVIIATKINPDLNQKINNIILSYLPYFVFIMYMINRGTVVTQSMFMNCDHSMLTYKFYREPKVLLGLFKERLKTLVVINLLPASVIGIGLGAILYVTGGTIDFTNYIVLFLSIISMSTFFSVHYLVMYYMLQPYNVNIEMKSTTYTIVQSITYIICYMMLKVKLPIIVFGVSTVIFSILYCIISLIIVYKFAPKTFKLRT